MDRLRSWIDLRNTITAVAVILIIGVTIMSIRSTAAAQPVTAQTPPPSVTVSFDLSAFASCHPAIQAGGPSTTNGSVIMLCLTDAVNTLIAYKQQGVGVDPVTAGEIIAFVRSVSDRSKYENLALSLDQQKLLDRYVNDLDKEFPSVR